MSKLKDIRKAQGLTQAELASAAGIQQATVSHLETGSMAINYTGAATVTRLALALGVDITEILEPGWDRGLK